MPSVDGMEASTLGRIRYKGKILNQRPRVRNYLGVSFDGKNKLVHRLVAEAFHGAPLHGAESMHLNHDPSDNSPDNLRWGTHADNMEMDRGNNHSFKGTENRNSKLSEAQVLAIKQAYQNRQSSKWGRAELAAKFGISETHCTRIARSYQGGWAHI